MSKAFNQGGKVYQTPPKNLKIKFIYLNTEVKQGQMPTKHTLASFANNNWLF